MERNTFDILKMQLVEYFKQIEKYQIHQRKWRWKRNKEHNLYLINLFNKSYQVIKILDYFNHSEMWSAKDLKQNQLDIDSFRKEIATSSHSKLQVLTIVLTKVIHEPLLFSNNDGIVFVNPETLVAQLKPIYSQIDQIETITFQEKPSNDDEVFDPKSITSDDLKEGSLLQKRMKDFHNLTTKQNIFLAYVFTFIPLLLPILVPFFVPQIREILQGKNDNSLIDGGFESQLMLGGSYKHLIFQAGQFWRWIVYPLAGDNMFNLFLSCLVIFYCARLVESFYKPWKLGLIILCTTVIVGFTHSVVASAMYHFKSQKIPNILTGPLYWAWMVIPPLYIFSFTKKDFSAFVVRRRLILPTVFMLVTFISSGDRLAMPLVLTFFVSFFISYFLGYTKQAWEWKRGVAVVVVLVLVLVVLILYLTNNRFFTDEDGWTHTILEDYVKLGLISQEKLDIFGIFR
ncbi:hypothetical protein [Spiroplasma endosymbiont of Dilophus febrilis]|uniref:hypothetical protein n=1 Tax=Spiroplasma endosymbiont of Dilophus febrilis TaxID=3066292 RepID=UPI00313BBB6E